MFEDKIYDNLDDISKLVEPFQGSINEELAKFPDEFELTKDMILDLYDGDWGWSSIRISEIVADKAKDLGLYKIQTRSGEISRQFFEFKVKDLEEGDEVIIDFKTGEVSHRIFLVKTKLGYDEEELEKMARKSIIETIQSELWSNSRVNKPRLNELADLYGAKEVKSDRSYKGKVRKFCKHLEFLMNERKLDIKDIELCKRFAKWIVLYISNGNLPALNNITKIKIMMHKNRPIYSIEEKGVV